MRFTTYGSLLALTLAAVSCNRSGNPNGIVVSQTYVHKYGVEVPQDYWTARGEDGKVVSTLTNGVTVSKSLDHGILEGDTTYTFPHSQTIQKVETYSQNNLVKELVNYTSGKPRQEVVYVSPDVVDVTRWYESGSIQAKEHYEKDDLITGYFYTPKNQQESKVAEGRGVRIQRDEYGQVLSHDNFENGHVTLVTTFHPNGTPKSVAPYINDVIEGLRKTYLPAGEPDTIEAWSNGTQNGLTTVFRNGERYAEVPYIDGVKQGIELRYRDGKDIVEEISWANGVQQGPSKTYIGDIVKTDWYYQGKQITKHAYDNLVRMGAVPR